MACRGVYYAVTLGEIDQILSLEGDDDAISDAVNHLFTPERESAGFLAPCDKAWDAIHRCLTDGTLEEIGKGTTPLSWAVLGGRNLYRGHSYIICLVTPEQVEDVVKALAPIDHDWLTSRYWKLDPRSYDGPHNDNDCEYTWSYFEDMRNLFNRAANAQRGVVFLTDQ